MIKSKRNLAISSISLVSLLSITIAATVVLVFESDSGNIKSSEDALWWAFATVTTVGYGDLYPVTTAGRITAAALMLVGIGLFSTLAGVVASLLLPSADDEADALRAKVARLEQQLAESKNAHWEHAARESKHQQL